jgi:hypothetical protein
MEWHPARLGCRGGKPRRTWNELATGSARCPTVHTRALRIVAQRLGEAWGLSGFVENRPAPAATSARPPPDGYTLHLGGQLLAVNVTLASMKGLDPVKDFEPIIG